MDKTSFNNKIIPLSNSLYRMAKSILQNADEAEDAVQDLLLRLWEMRNELSKLENPKAYAFRSLRNRCLDILRLQKPQEELDEKNIDKGSDPYEQTEMKDTINRVYLLIEKLPEQQRSIIRMRDVEGMEIAEIADIMEISENTVNVTLSRARKKLREALIKPYEIQKEIVK